MQYPWYELVSGTELHQGDILLECPAIVVPPGAIRQPGEQAVTVELQNAIIMTQSCELAIRDNGSSDAEDVLLATVYFRHELNTNKRFRRADGWENARKGRFPGYHVLNRCELPGHELDFMLVDFRRIFTLGVDVVREFAGDGAKQRARLLPPYREHLAQAFARFFMRVGLPLDIPPFK